MPFAATAIAKCALRFGLRILRLMRSSQFDAYLLSFVTASSILNRFNHFRNVCRPRKEKNIYAKTLPLNLMLEEIGFCGANARISIYAAFNFSRTTSNSSMEIIERKKNDRRTTACASQSYKWFRDISVIIDLPRRERVTCGRRTTTCLRAQMCDDIGANRAADFIMRDNISVPFDFVWLKRRFFLFITFFFLAPRFLREPHRHLIRRNGLFGMWLWRNRNDFAQNEDEEGAA